MHANVKYFLLLWITTDICAQADDFVYDYYVNKGVTRVTLFSCDQMQNDFRFVRRMSELGISVSVTHPTSQFYNVSNLVARKAAWASGMFLDTRCHTREVNEKIIAQTSEYRLYETIHLWLILGSTLEEVTKLLNDTPYSVATDLAVGVETEIGYDLYDIYNPCKVRGGTLNVTKLGLWNFDTGLMIILTEPKLVRRSNLFGLVIKVSSLMAYKSPETTAENYLQDYTAKWQDPMSKYGYGILRAAADLSNFTLEIHQATQWVIMVNGTEEGMMPTVARAEVDIAGTPGASERFIEYPQLHLLMSLWPYRSFFILCSNEESLKLTQLLTPFTIDSWCASFVTAILFIMVVTIIQMSEYGHGWVVETGHAIFAVLEATCQQGLAFVPNRLSGRIAFLFLLLLGVLLSNYYGASVVSVRLSQPPEKMNDSLYSLAKSHMTVASENYRSIDWGLQARSMIEWEVHYFKEKVWDKLPLSRYVDPEIGLANVAQGGYAYHATPEVSYPYVESHWDDNAICAMTEVHVVLPRILGFFDRTDNPFTEILKIGFTKFQDMGLEKRAIKRWKARVPFCSPDARSIQSVTFFEVALAVLMLSIGMVVALIIFFFERTAYKLHLPRRDAEKPRKKLRFIGKSTLQRA